MDIKYDEYLEKGTEKLLEIFSSSDVSEGEKEVIVNAFSNELINNIGDTSKLQDYEHLIYSASLKYIDDCLSKTLLNNQASYSDYEKAIKYCFREREILQVFQAKMWNLPDISNKDLDKCELALRTRQESTSISSKIADEDYKIDELINTAQTDLSVNACDSALKLLDELANDLSICKQKKLPVPSVNNKDTKKIAKKLADIRKIAEKKESLHQEMQGVDSQIDSIVSMPRTEAKQWEEIIALCNKQATLTAECNKKHWPQPSLLQADTNGLITKYQHYLHMNDLDKAIVSSRPLLGSGKQYKTFFSNCSQLSSCIDTCKKNKWELPELATVNPKKLEAEVREEKNQKDRVKKIKQTITLAAVGVFAVFILIAFCIIKYREGKVRIPFDPDYVEGTSLSTIYNELDEAGFENIQKVADYSGWSQSDEVITVSIDNQDTYKKDMYKKPDVSVVITYSSSGRIYATDLLNDWKKSKYTDVVENLKEAGFTNIITNEVDTAEKDLNQLVQAIELNGLSYTNEHCYLPENAPITITYYSLKIGIGNDSAQFIGQDYKNVVNSLEESGFTNVQTEEISTGWAKGNSVIGVNVNNSESYSSSDSFAPDVKIVVKYSSNDRIDITDLVKNWNTKQCESLKTGLNLKAFANVTYKEKITDNKSLNRLVAGITVNNQQFNQGDCFVQKNASIVVEYYVLRITIGQSSSDFKENKEGKYKSVVNSLTEMGFTNITVYRNDDLFNGWLTKEGSIESISINGNDSFDATNQYYYNAPIVIVVNTFKGKGCEDITKVKP